MPPRNVIYPFFTLIRRLSRTCTGVREPGRATKGNGAGEVTKESGSVCVLFRVSVGGCCVVCCGFPVCYGLGAILLVLSHGFGDCHVCSSRM